MHLQRYMNSDSTSVGNSKDVKPVEKCIVLEWYRRQVYLSENK